jgi:hypothetical protein
MKEITAWITDNWEALLTFLGIGTGGLAGGIASKKFIDLTQDKKIKDIEIKVEKMDREIKEVKEAEKENKLMDKNFREQYDRESKEVKVILGSLKDGQDRIFDHIITLSRK